MTPLRYSIISKSLYRAASTHSSTSNPKYVNLAKSGKENFEKDFKNSHVKTTLFQKLLLGVGSGVISITSPSRGDMIAVMGEVTGYQAWEYIQSRMMESKEGRQILEEKPRISSGSVDLEKLKSYPDGTLGKAYSDFLTRYATSVANTMPSQNGKLKKGYSPDSRNAVQFVDDLELAYVAQRYREAHDLFHTLLDMPTNMLGEVTVKWVEAIQLKLPMCAAGALFGSVRLAPKFTRTYSTRSIIKIDPEVAAKVESNLIKPKEIPGALHENCVKLPEFYLKSIALSLQGKSKKLLRQSGMKLKKILFARPLPVEVKDMEIEKKRLIKELENDYLDEDGICVWSELDKEVERRVRQKFNLQLMFWKPIKYNLDSGLQYLISRSPGEFAVLKRVLKEIAVRDKSFAPTALLDFGSGVGTVNWAAHEIWGESIKLYYCVDISQSMHDIAEMILTQKDKLEKPFIQNVYYRLHLPIFQTPYDIVVSSFTLGELPSRERRMQIITKLWNLTKNYLIVIENGNIPGFKMITEVRDYLIDANENSNIDYHIFAPCPHEKDCPILTQPRRKPVCKFSMLHDNLDQYLKGKVDQFSYSYIIFKKGKKPLDRKCRIVKEVCKRHKHTRCFLCTPEGEYKEVVVTVSKHGKTAYKCMRKARWGDLLSGSLEEQEKIDSVNRKFISSPEVTPENEEYYSSEDSEDESEDCEVKNSEDESEDSEVKDSDTHKKPE